MNVWGQQEKEPTAIVKTAHKDYLKRSAGHWLQEKLGMCKAYSPGGASTSQLCRSCSRRASEGPVSTMRDRVRNHIQLPWKTIPFSPLCLPEFEYNDVRTKQLQSSREKDVLWAEKKKTRKHPPYHDPGCGERKGPNVKASSQFWSFSGTVKLEPLNW